MVTPEPLEKYLDYLSNKRNDLRKDPENFLRVDIINQEIFSVRCDIASRKIGVKNESSNMPSN